MAKTLLARADDTLVFKNKSVTTSSFSSNSDSTYPYKANIS